MEKILPKDYGNTLRPLNVDLLTAVLTKVEKAISRYKLEIPLDLKAWFMTRVYQVCQARKIPTNQIQVGPYLRQLAMIGEERAKLA